MAIRNADVYDTITGRKRKVPEHWLDRFPNRFKRTPSARAAAPEEPAPTVEDVQEPKKSSSSSAKKTNAQNKEGKKK